MQQGQGSQSCTTLSPSPRCSSKNTLWRNLGGPFVSFSFAAYFWIWSQMFFKAIRIWTGGLFSRSPAHNTWSSFPEWFLDVQAGQAGSVSRKSAMSNCEDLRELRSYALWAPGFVARICVDSCKPCKMKQQVPGSPPSGSRLRGSYSLTQHLSRAHCLSL